MNTHNYILDENHNPVPEPDMLKWAEFMKTNILVAQDTAVVSLLGAKVGEIKVSTVFLGVDHNFSDTGDPILFETMVFGDKLDGEMDRCCTYEAALKMHELMCERVKWSPKS